MGNRRYLTIWTAVFMAAAIALSGCQTGGGTGGGTIPGTGIGNPAAVTEGPATEQTEAARPAAAEQPSAANRDGAAACADDFYDAVNHDLLAGWEIPPDQAEISWFRLAREDSYNKVNGIIQQASAQTALERGSDLYNIRALNLTGMDQEARNREGYGKHAGAFLRQVDEAATVEELLKASLQFHRNYGFYSLIGFEYSGDGEDSSAKVLYMNKPDTGLSREVWFSEDPSNRKRVEEYKKYLTKLHESRGRGSREAAGAVEQVTVMMKDLASATLKIEERYEADKTYNIYTAGNAAALCEEALPVSMLSHIFGIDKDEKTVVSEPEVCRKLGSYLTEENLPLLKEYVKTCLYSDLCGMTDTASLDAAQEYEKTSNGVEEKKPFARTVSETVQQYLGYQCGRVFCEKYFNEDARQDVSDIIRQIIEVYDKRLAHMEWMTESTRLEARKKLASMVIKAGYPDQWPQDKYPLSLTPPEDGGLYIDNLLEICQASQDYAYETKNEPVDRSEWHMTPQTVNAYYNPGNNEIVFPAGILQSPFYDADAKPVVNLGGIGTVIGHEITHAFDTSGSQYDENGNLRDWWTEQDRRRFKELARQTIDYYNAMEVNGIPVNGSLSVTENIADLGGVSCVTEIAEKEGYDLRELYHAYASIWAKKARAEYLSYAMTTDTHSPANIRVNAVLSAVNGFYDAFGVKEGDGMYRKPEDRPEIW